jgi:hypothetical protein
MFGTPAVPQPSALVISSIPFEKSVATSVAVGACGPSAPLE